MRAPSVESRRSQLGPTFVKLRFLVAHCCEAEHDVEMVTGRENGRAEIYESQFNNKLLIRPFSAQ
jgi:hypothetical protein